MFKTTVISVLLVVIGRVLNYIAEYRNDGKMPVWVPSWFPTADKDKLHGDGYSVLTERTRIKVFCDIIPWPVIRRDGIYLAMASIGDMLQYAAIVFFIMVEFF